MKKINLLASVGTTGIVAATMIVAPAFACTPVGSIVKQVQDQTTGSTMVDANSVSSALNVNSSATLIYSITIKNSGAAESNGNDNMNAVTLNDTLPNGLQLESNPSQTAITENLGTIKPGASVTKTYAVKVTDTTNGDIITNKACYTGTSVDNQDNQSGCDVAVVKVVVPTPVPTPTPAPTPTPPSANTTTAPATLPDTGSTALSTSLFVSGAVVLGYVLSMLKLRRIKPFQKNNV
jgi:uncharacterized repeat protein (TIGR01451 family)